MRSGISPRPVLCTLPFYERLNMSIKLNLAISAACVAALMVFESASGAETPPLKALLITGGCCHDYAKQKDILKSGLEERANLRVDILYVDDSSTSPKLPILGNPDYARGYDVIIHDECAADISDETIVRAMLNPHREGMPGVNLHCGVHSYRIGDPNKPAVTNTPHALWFEYLGLQSSGHGAQLPIAIAFTDHQNPITRDLADWTTINEELYNNIQVFPTASALAHGKQVVKGQNGTQRTNDYVVVWTNQYQGRARVFSTTIGHNNQTVADPRYLDLVTRGLLWACDKLGADGKPQTGYAK
jgi:type 1 glutamine amidotransferase